MEPSPPRSRIAGADALAAALARGVQVPVVLLRRDACDASRDVAGRARASGARVLPTTAAELRRLADSADVVDVLAMAGARPDVPLAEALARPGAAWLLAGLRYPGNVGFALRTAEVTGAAAAVADRAVAGAARRRALRASMRCDRFFPVAWEEPSEAIGAARAAGRRIVAVEDAGGAAPWEADLTGPVLLVVGGERTGIDAALLARCDATVRIPMRGFVPALNVHAALAAVAVERLRQEGSRRSPGGSAPR